MKIKTWIKYEESHIPPRCRKPRYNECEDYVDINLPEVTMDNLRLAFEDSSYDGAGKIYFYKGKLWTQAKLRNKNYAEEHGFHTALDELVWCHENCSTYFRFDFDREHYRKDTSRQAVVKQARNDMKRYLLVDGILFEKTAEPRYCIYTFGLGHNHGSTALSVNYGYNPNISKECYFSALQGDEAVTEAKKIALGRGDTESVGRIEAEISVFMPELVKVKPQKQHGDGNKLLNTFNTITSAAPDTLTAGLLCIAATQQQILQ